MSVNWSEVYTETYADLVRFLIGKVWDRERAQDLAQETFVRALRHDPDHPRAWLFSVAANLARDEARTAVRRRGHLTLLKNEVETEGPTEAGVTAKLEGDETRRQVEFAMEQLSERDREVLLLWSAGNSYGDIAQITDLSPGAIGTTLARARKRLLDAYEGLENDVARHRG